MSRCPPPPSPQSRLLPRPRLSPSRKPAKQKANLHPPPPTPPQLNRYKHYGALAKAFAAVIPFSISPASAAWPCADVARPPPLPPHASREARSHSSALRPPCENKSDANKSIRWRHWKRGRRRGEGGAIMMTHAIITGNASSFCRDGATCWVLTGPGCVAKRGDGPCCYSSPLPWFAKPRLAMAMGSEIHWTSWLNNGCPFSRSHSS